LNEDIIKGQMEELIASSRQMPASERKAILSWRVSDFQVPVTFFL